MAVTVYEKRQAILVTEFDRYVMEHQDFAAQIPAGQPLGDRLKPAPDVVPFQV